MNRSEIAELVARVGATWPNFRVPATPEDARLLVSEWSAHLGDLPASTVTAAMRKYASEGHEWPPPVGTLRRLSVHATGSAAPAVDEAWGEVRRAFSSHGYTRVPDWSHPAVAAAVRSMGGWRHLCETCTITSEVADRAHFQRFYAAAAEREQPDATPPTDRAVLSNIAGSIGHRGELSAS